MKTSKVTSCQGAGTWTSKRDGTLYHSFDYEMEDGSHFQASHKDPSNAIQPGEMAEYEITGTNEYGTRGKIRKPSQYSGGGSRGAGDLLGIKIGHALNCACALLGPSAEFWEHSPQERSGAIKIYAKMIYRISEEMNNEYKSQE